MIEMSKLRMSQEVAGGHTPIWIPDPSVAAQSQIFAFGQYVADTYGVDTESYYDLWAWSVAHIEEFWLAVWKFFGIHSTARYREVLSPAVMPGARWFEGSRISYAEHALRCNAGSESAILVVTEEGTTEVVSWDELRAEVGAFSKWLRGIGVGCGDRVVGYLPNGRHAVVALLATASVGAIWSVCGQDYGSSGAAARFLQLEPSVLIVADGYHWNGRRHDRRGEAQVLRRALPSLKATVAVTHLGLDVVGDGVISWAEATSAPAEPYFEHMAFDDPLWVLFSSGTTGPPKGIVHGHGGVLIEHYKMLALHLDLRPHEPFLWYTTTNWMMWNVVVSGLLVGAQIVLYDGSPTYPSPGRLFELAAQHRVGVLGVSPGYLLACQKASIEPGRDLDVGTIRILASTGSPLPAQSYFWVRDHVSDHVQLDSTSGGTDVVSAFAGSAPTTPVWAGEVSAPMLGVALDAWDEEGNSVVEEVGELVITEPMPSMPVSFWDDADGYRYHDAYFAVFPEVWRHGDWITRTNRGSVIISGRSDSTLNRQGVRLGSADIYNVVEKLDEVREALVVGVERPDGGYWMPLFVVLEPGIRLDDGLRVRIANAIREEASPRHVPDEIIEVTAIPHTRTGKKLEVPVKRILQGVPVELAVSGDAVDEVSVLSYFRKFAKQ